MCTGFEVCTVDHMKGGTVRLDATVMFSDECEINLDDPTPEDDQDLRGCSVMTFAHEHEDCLLYTSPSPRD